MKIVAVGDISFEDGDNAKKTFKNIKNQTPDLVLALGDLTYVKKADVFVAEAIGIDNKKIRPLLGNHDDDDDDDKLSPDEARAFWKLLREKYLDTSDVELVPINGPNPQGEKEKYYSFTIEKICFVILYTHTDYVDDERQKEFAFQKLLEASSNPNIDWIIVCYHKPSVTCNTRGGHVPDKIFAEKYHQLFDHFGVDMILTGHNHNYQRTKLVKNNPENVTVPKVVNEVGSDVYDTRKGRIFMLIGSGGRKAERFRNIDEDDKEKYVKFRNPEGNERTVNRLPNDKKYGILLLEFTNKTMEGKFITNKGVEQGNRDVIDTFRIDKSSIMDSHDCGDHEHWDEATQSCVHDESSRFKRGTGNDDEIICDKNT